MKVEKYCIFMTSAEFIEWLKDYKVTRRIDRLQTHHTYRPNLETRKDDTHLETFMAVRRYHMVDLEWKAPGMNIMIYEDGIVCISLERNINSVPAGIAGANTDALCIETIGNYDRNIIDNGRLVKLDKMPNAQRLAVLDVYAALAMKLNLPVDDKHIVYHAWYTKDGKWLGDYIPGRSSKPCPGINWWGGHGNTKAAANRGFLPDIRARLAELRGVTPVATKPMVPVKEVPTIIEEDLPMTKEERAEVEQLKKEMQRVIEENKELKEVVKNISTRLNLNGDVEIPKVYHEAVAAAKKVGIITSSSDKSKMELNVIQMFQNAGLLDASVLAKLKEK